MEPGIEYRLGLCLGAMRVVAEIIDWNADDQLGEQTHKAIVMALQGVIKEASPAVVLEEVKPVATSPVTGEPHSGDDDRPLYDFG